ncbi:hypothetical protein KC326_g11 [Hortaea werneckii]|nr:hypothetical protein KC326_g11 [Hortaea werneckii]
MGREVNRPYYFCLSASVSRNATSSLAVMSTGHETAFPDSGFAAVSAQAGPRGRARGLAGKSKGLSPLLQLLKPNATLAMASGLHCFPGPVILKIPEVTADDAGSERGASSFSAMRAAARYMVQTLTSSTRISTDLHRQESQGTHSYVHNLELLKRYLKELSQCETTLYFPTRNATDGISTASSRKAPIMFISCLSASLHHRHRLHHPHRPLALEPVSAHQHPQAQRRRHCSLPSSPRRACSLLQPVADRSCARISLVRMRWPVGNERTSSPTEPLCSSPFASTQLSGSSPVPSSTASHFLHSRLTRQDPCVAATGRRRAACREEKVLVQKLFGGGGVKVSSEVPFVKVPLVELDFDSGRIRSLCSHSIQSAPSL